MAERDDDAWFAPKLFGVGATPVRWQGWALVTGIVGLVLLDMRLVESRVVRLVVAIALLILLTAISWHKTAGGWHWRWGRRN